MKWLLGTIALLFLNAPDYVCPEPGLHKQPKTRVAFGLSYDQGQGIHIQTRLGRRAAEIGPKGVHKCRR